MHVAHFEACAFTRETSGTKRRERAHVFELSENVLLLHELRELVGREEFADSSLERTRVYERHRKRRLAINGRHAVLDVALHARHTDTHTRLEEFADKANTTEAEVVDVIWTRCRIRVQARDFGDDADEVNEV